MLGKPTGWANQSNEGWHGQTVQNPCKSYSSSAYINVGTVRIAFLWRKTVQKSYYSRVYIHVRTVVIAFCSANVPLGFGVVAKRRNHDLFSLCHVFCLLRLVRLALLAAGKRGNPRLHFGQQISEAKYACAHRDADNARTETLFVMKLHELVKLLQFLPDHLEILDR